MARPPSPLWPVHLPICLSIMNELGSFPCSAVFSTPVKCDAPNRPDAPHILSFPIIRGRLQNGFYNDSRDWVNDLALLFDAIGKQSNDPAPNSLVRAYIAEEFIERLRKRTVLFDATTPDTWLRHIEKLNLKLGRLLGTSPPVAQPHFPFIPPPPSTIKRVSAAQFEYIQKMGDRIKNPVHLFGLARILECEPSAVKMEGSEMKVDLNGISQATACRLFDYLRHTFPNVAVEMPSYKSGFTARAPSV
jgi:hypothetical protein